PEIRIGAARQMEPGAFSSSGELAAGAYRIAGPGCGAAPSLGGREEAGAAAGSASAAHTSAASDTRARAMARKLVRERIVLICFLPPAVRPLADRSKAIEAIRTESGRVPKTRDYLV